MVVCVAGYASTPRLTVSKRASHYLRFIDSVRRNNSNLTLHTSYGIRLDYTTLNCARIYHLKIEDNIRKKENLY